MKQQIVRNEKIKILDEQAEKGEIKENLEILPQLSNEDVILVTDPEDRLFDLFSTKFS